MEYKYDFELSSKGRIFLYLYQVIPNLDIIKYIYEMKDNMEYDDILTYYGLCPINVKISGHWIPKHINDGWKIMNLKDIMKMNALFLKIIMKRGLICKFILSDDCNPELINNGFWEFCVNLDDDINYNPSLKDKINCINSILSDTYYLQEDICKKLNNIYEYYDKFNDDDFNYLVRIGIDQYNNWYIPTIFF